MTETELVKRSAAYGVRWVWFILAGFFWRIVITLSIFLVALVLLLPVGMIAGGIGAVAGDTVSFVVGLLALVAWPVCLGAIGYKAGLGYPRLSVDISLHSPTKEQGQDGASGTDRAPPTTSTEVHNDG
jgi:hypothetical protein